MSQARVIVAAAPPAEYMHGGGGLRLSSTTATCTSPHHLYCSGKGRAAGPARLVLGVQGCRRTQGMIATFLPKRSEVDVA